MSGAAADRNLLLGIIALQMDFIPRDALVAAMNAWVLKKAIPLSQILQDQGALSNSRRVLLNALVDEHLKQHGNDTQKSLAALSSIASMREDLSKIADPDIQASLPLVSAKRPDQHDDPYRTIGQSSVGESTSPGLRFRILRPHAKGGLGQVSVALDTELDRPVALKEIQDRHADDQNSRARFVQEAEITGKLEHPGIIPVYGMGHYADGRPFYAMRFIKGDSLMEAIATFHADESLKRNPGRRSLRLRELMRRFLDVCNAIAYAHSRGVLHRDLKPGNIMLGPYGETLVVDWGLAKPVGAETMAAEPSAVAEGPIRLSAMSGSRAETLSGSMVGTPAYASPEQLTGRLDLLTPASDVYSLGATLYTLLTGRIPVQASDLQELLRKVQKGEITPPRSLDRTIPRPLEAICLKALALNPENRYQTAEGLRADLERWLADEPVAVWREPPSVRARRWMRRHRTMVTSTAAVLVFGLAGLAGFATVISGKNLQLSDKNLELDARNQELARQRHAAVQERDHARMSESETRAVLDFFEEKVLAATRPEGQEGGLDKDVTIRRAVDAAEPRIASTFRDKPVVEASIRNTLGETYRYLGEPVLAIAQYERSLQLRRDALGQNHPQTLATMNNLANAYRDAARYGDAVRGFEETLRLRKAALGSDHPDTLVTMNNLAWAYYSAGRLKKALPLFKETLRLQTSRLEPNHPDTLTTMNRLAVAYKSAGRLNDALALFERTLKLRRSALGTEHPDTLISIGNLASAYRSAGRDNEAMPLFEECFKLRMAKLGPDHPSTVNATNWLALAYKTGGRLHEAVPLYEQALKLQKARFGSDHPDTLVMMNNLALAYQAAGRLNDSLALSEEMLKLRKNALALDQPNRLAAMNYLASAYERTGRLNEAVPLFEETLKLRKAELGADHPDTLQSMNNLALAYEAAGRLKEATPLFEETLKGRRATLGADHPETLTAMNYLAVAYERAGRLKEAVPLYQDALKLRTTKLGPDHRDTLLSMNNLAEAYRKANRLSEAVPLHEATLKLRKAKLGPDDVATLISMNNLALAYETAGRLNDALPLFEEVLRIRKAKFGADLPNTLTAMNHLGAAYRDAGRLSDALPLLEEALKLRKAKLGTDHPATLLSMNGLALAYLHASRQSEARRLFVETLKLRKAKLGPTHIDTLISMNNLASGYSDAGRLHDAILIYEETLELMKQKLGSEHVETLNTMNNLAAAYLTSKKWTKADQTARDCLAVREKNDPQHWRRFYTMSQLGAALAGQKKYAEAEPLLIQGYLGLKAREANIPARYRQRMIVAATRIVHLYESWHKDNEAQEWKVKLGLRDLPAAVFAAP